MAGLFVPRTELSVTKNLVGPYLTLLPNLGVRAYTRLRFSLAGCQHATPITLNMELETSVYYHVVDVCCYDEHAISAKRMKVRRTGLRPSV